MTALKRLAMAAGVAWVLFACLTLTSSRVVAQDVVYGNAGGSGGAAGGATAANQDDLETLIGEVQESPTQHTLLGRLASLQTLFAAFTPPGLAEGVAWSDGNSVNTAGCRVTTNASAGTGVGNGEVASHNCTTTGMLRVAAVPYNSSGTEITSSDASHGSAVVTQGPGIQLEAKSFDGSALPNTVTEGQAIRAAGTASGVAYAMITSHTGADERLGPATCNSSLSAGAVLETEIKASAGILVGYNVQHIDATPVVCRLYNDTAANTDENDTPIARFIIPANSTASLGSGTVNLIPAGGMNFSTAITTRCTTGLADTNTGALTATEVVVNYCYR